MSKWYEVNFSFVRVVAVEVRDDEGRDKAIEYGGHEIESDWEEAEANPVMERYVEGLVRHADFVTRLPKNDKQ